MDASQIRNNIFTTLTREMMGPCAGEREILAEDPRQLYLLGVLGPKGASAQPQEDEELAAAGDFEGAGEEGGAEATAAQPTMIPNSFGFTFCVDEVAEVLHINASWGRYKSKVDPDEKRLWVRTPVEGSLTLNLCQVPSERPESPVRHVLLDRRGEALDAAAVTAIIRRRERGYIVTLFLVNEQPLTRRSQVGRHLFQARLEVSEPNSAAVFLKHPSQDPRRGLDPIDAMELSELDMQYRSHVEFAVGHGTSVHAAYDPSEPRRAYALKTVALPHYEVPRTDAADLPEVVRDMKQLAETQDLGSALQPLVDQYGAWIGDQRALLDSGADGLGAWREQGLAVLGRCEEARGRIAAGIQLLAEDAEAARCFRFANAAMHLQRVHGLYAEARRRHCDNPRAPKGNLDELDIPENRSWRPFQLAFVLLNLPGLTRLDHPERAADRSAGSDLLFFPTGGGKTEAYLGLAAYTLGLRRRQGVVGGRDGAAGVAVLMRYTLRLLTLQQYQRAAALICACETLRRRAVGEGDPLWGHNPFRIGLWVGAGSTPNKTEDAAEAVKQIIRNKSAGGGGVVQFRNCPWCGAKIEPGTHLKVDSTGLYRTFTYCGDVLGRCPFTENQAPDEGLPVLCVDEEIFRLLPAMVIATVDKFAQMPFNGQVQMLFGRVNGYCSRHGYRSPETRDADSHPKKGDLPSAHTVSVSPLRPPDLIIQDELHLISGPLGTLVGLYETAVEQLATFEVDGHTVRPKLILSTATIRRAADQVKNLFNHEVAVFPPPGLSADDNFFALRRKPTNATPGRLYVGLCAPGRKIKNVMIRVYATLLRAAQYEYDQYDEAADPYMTLVGYFNSRRELGGLRRMVDDAINAQTRKKGQRRLGQRYLDPGRGVGELTSRLRATDIPEILDNLSLSFSKKAETERQALYARGGKGPGRRLKPYDVMLATNMIQVGVDVPRLGLMVVARQPKSTAEYIQATSRVGRRAPGLVVTVFNWAHPRDLSHYERFEAYHAAFYKFVEANSVTPFSSRARDRALSAVLVSLVRQLDASLNGNERARELTMDHPNVRRALDAVLARAEVVGEGPLLRKRVEGELMHRLDVWLKQARPRDGVAPLAYRKVGEQADLSRPLLLRAGRDQPENEQQALFVCPTSLRNVEAPVDLVHEGSLKLDDEPPIEPMGAKEGS